MRSHRRPGGSHWARSALPPTRPQASAWIKERPRAADPARLRRIGEPVAERPFTPGAPHKKLKSQRSERDPGSYPSVLDCNTSTNTGNKKRKRARSSHDRGSSGSATDSLRESREHDQVGVKPNTFNEADAEEREAGRCVLQPS